MNYIHLKHYHTAVQGFNHPLLKGVKGKRLDSEHLDALAKGVAGGGDPTELIMELRGCVGLLVGRFIANWPDTYSHLDDMVSEGMAEISRLCSSITFDLLAERAILVIATSRSQFAIEKMLNEMRSLSAPSHWTQLDRLKSDRDPIYLQADTNEYSDVPHPEDAGDEWKRDLLDALGQIQPSDEIDAALLESFNWGRGYRELADELGVGVATIHRRKRRLYEQYLQLTR
jgi:hypothetical protein